MKVVKDTPFEVAWIPTTFREGKTVLTMLVKATFEIPLQGPCTIAEDQQLLTGDIYFEDDIEKSVRYESDFAPLKLRSECFVIGHCYAPKGMAVRSLGVGFSVGPIQRRLQVFGDRTVNPQSGKVETKPFQKLLLCWEHSFGGPQLAENPLGKGLEKDKKGKLHWPNIEDPQHFYAPAPPYPRPVGLGPVPRIWKTRMQYTGSYDEEWEKNRWPWLPDDFRMDYFNGAPQAQHMRGFFRGDERIVLENLHPEQAKIDCSLPGLRARLFLLAKQSASDGSNPTLREVAIHLDTITIDTDAAKILCVWRGQVDVKSANSEEFSHVFAVHEKLSEPKSIAFYNDRFEICLADLEAEESEFEAENSDFYVERAHDEDTESAANDFEVDTQDADSELLAELKALGLSVDELGVDPSAFSSMDDEAGSLEALKGFVDDSELSELLHSDEAEKIASPEPLVEADSPQSLRAYVIESYRQGKSLQGADLVDVDLSELDLQGVDLTEAVLSRANLHRTILDHAKLDGAVLLEVKCDEASFAHASLKDAVLTAAHGVKADFTNADLSGATASEADFSYACFQQVQGYELEMNRARLAETNFSKAMLKQAEFSSSYVDGSTFADACLEDASLDEGASVKNVNFDRCNLYLLRATDGSDFSKSSFKQVQANEARFAGSVLWEVDFSASKLEQADFSQADVQKSIFVNSWLRGANFREAILHGVDFSKSNLFEANFEAAKVKNVNFSESCLIRAEFWQVNVSELHLAGAMVNETKLA